MASPLSYASIRRLGWGHSHRGSATLVQHAYTGTKASKEGGQRSVAQPHEANEFGDGSGHYESDQEAQARAISCMSDQLE